MNDLVSLILLLMICADAFGQKITYNYLVDSTDNDTREVMTLLKTICIIVRRIRLKIITGTQMINRNICNSTSWKVNSSHHYTWASRFMF